MPLPLLITPKVLTLHHIDQIYLLRKGYQIACLPAAVGAGHNRGYGEQFS